MSSLKDKGWNSMKQMLDEHMPVENPKRTIAWWYLAPALSLLILLSGIVYFIQPFNYEAFPLSESLQYAKDKSNLATHLHENETGEQNISTALESSEASESFPNPNMLSSEASQTKQSAGQAEFTSQNSAALPVNATTRSEHDAKNAIQKRTQNQLSPDKTQDQPAKTDKNIAKEKEEEPIAMRPVDAEDYSNISTSIDPLTLRSFEILSEEAMDLAAPMAPSFVPLVQNIFQLRGHSGLYIPPGAGISGGALGLSARLEFREKWGIHGGVDIGYLRPYKQNDFTRQFSQSVEPDNTSNYAEIKHYWLLDYYVQASYRPVKPVSVQLGFFHTRRLNTPSVDLLTDDQTIPLGGVGTSSAEDNNVVDYRPTYTGLQAGMHIHLTPRWSIDGQYKLGTQSWFTSKNATRSNASSSEQMQLFQVGVSYRIL